jgi:hypothetical protein
MSAKLRRTATERIETMADDDNDLENVPDDLEEQLDDLSETLQREHDDSPDVPPPPPPPD